MHRFLHFGIHENAFTVTQNALRLQLPGALPPRSAGGDSAPCTPLGAEPSDPQHDYLDPPVSLRCVVSDRVQHPVLACTTCCTTCCTTRRTTCFYSVDIPFSLFIMVAIAVDRYLCICRPFTRLLTVRRAKMTVVALNLTRTLPAADLFLLYAT